MFLALLSAGEIGIGGNRRAESTRSDQRFQRRIQLGC